MASKQPITVKAHLFEDLRRWVVQNPTLEAIRADVRTRFELHPDGFTLSYLDEDGDQITLGSEADLNELLVPGVTKVALTVRPRRGGHNDADEQPSRCEQPSEPPRCEGSQQPESEHEGVQGEARAASLSVRELKGRLETLGVGYGDCTEKHELETRLREAE